MAAAVSDFRPRAVANSKIKKSENEGTLELQLVENPDVLKEIVGRRLENQLIIGFAAETTHGDESELIRLGIEKLHRKGCDFIFANDVSTDAEFGSVTTVGYLLRAGAEPVKFAGHKSTVAESILRAILRQSL